MSATLVAAKALALVLLFPLNILVLLGVSGLLIARGRRGPGLILLVLVVLVLALASMPVVSDRFMRATETEPALPASIFEGMGGDAGKAAVNLQGARAIVVLSGGIALSQPEFGTDAAGASTLERIRYGAWLHRRTGLPLLVTGGAAGPGQEAAAQIMQRELQELFNVPVQWVEPRAADTAENAEFSWSMLDPEGIRTVVLVTSASHMRRARASFEKAGFRVVSAPTGFHVEQPDTMLRFIPQSAALRQTDTALHEWIGTLWYRLRGKAD